MNITNIDISLKANIKQSIVIGCELLHFVEDNRIGDSKILDNNFSLQIPYELVVVIDIFPIELLKPELRDDVKIIDQSLNSVNQSSVAVGICVCQYVYEAVGCF